MKQLFGFAYLGGVLWLLGWEITALITNHSYTLSEIWWTLEGKGWTATRYGTLVILAFLLVHLAFGWLK